MSWDSPHGEVTEALLFMKLEDQYRPKPEAKSGS